MSVADPDPSARRLTLGVTSSAGEPARRLRARHPRRVALAGLGLALIAVAVVVSDPFAGSNRPGGVADNATATSLATVTRRPLSSQAQVNATLGYADPSSIRVPSGTAPSGLQQAEQSVAASDGMLQTARASLAADGETLADARAILSAARQKQSVDCAGVGAAELSPASSSSSGEGTPGSSSPGGTGSGPCASDAQVVSSDGLGYRGDAIKLAGDRASVTSAQAARARAQASLLAVRSSAAMYGQGSTFTTLPTVGQVLTRGRSLYQIDGQPVLLLYGSVVASRAFRAGMSTGRTVAALNANLNALGYASGLTGDTFSAASAGAVRALQSAHGLTATGELLVGSVVFEPGPVRVTSVTPTVGANVTPGPVLGISSTVPQVTIELSAAQQSDVKVGDPVTITLPNDQTTPGVVSSVGTVAKTPSNKGGEGKGGGGGEEGAPTIEVDVAPSDPSAIGHLDEAPVTVSITTASVPSALVVPVNALLALAGGGDALEVVEGRVHRLEAVSPGLFDDADGLVQVSGPGVSAGQRVVVPAT
jgi:peptidoglycan hydrolase-like protein with peptidoglycan-binding domain